MISEAKFMIIPHTQHHFRKEKIGEEAKWYTLEHTYGSIKRTARKKATDRERDRERQRQTETDRDRDRQTESAFSRLLVILIQKLM